MNIVIQKFGGSSVSTLDRIKTVASIIENTVLSGNRVVSVVSAMGNHTNELMSEAKSIDPFPNDRDLDLLLSAGERISMSLLSIAIRARGIKTLSLTGSQSGIITDDNHGKAKIHSIRADRIHTGIEQFPVIIVAGFQGVSQNTKDVTTLGRGGSDLTAIALAHSLNASKCELYKDVDGICTADPRTVPNAQKVDQISWKNMTHLSIGGASVLHTRAASLAQRFKIAIEFKNTFTPNQAGTTVKTEVSNHETFITKKTNQILIQIYFKKDKTPLMRCSHFLEKMGLAPAVFEVHYESGAYRLTFIVPHLVEEQLFRFLEIQVSTQEILRYHIEHKLASIALVGDSLGKLSRNTIRLIEHVEKNHFQAFFSSSLITILVPEYLAKKTMGDLHEILNGTQK